MVVFPSGFSGVRASFPGSFSTIEKKVHGRNKRHQGKPGRRARVPPSPFYVLRPPAAPSGRLPFPRTADKRSQLMPEAGPLLPPPTRCAGDATDETLPCLRSGGVRGDRHLPQLRRPDRRGPPHHRRLPHHRCPARGPLHLSVPGRARAHQRRSHDPALHTALGCRRAGGRPAAARARGVEKAPRRGVRAAPRHPPLRRRSVVPHQRMGRERKLGVAPRLRPAGRPAPALRALSPDGRHACRASCRTSTSSPTSS